MKRIITLNLAILVILSSIFSCKPSVEGEQQAWENNKKQVETLKMDYPQFAEVIDAQFATATEAMAAAVSISDEEQKAEAMDAANDLISSSFVGKLASIERRMESIGDQQAKLSTMRMQKSVVRRAENALKAGNRALSSADKSLASGAKSVDEAEEVIGEVNSDLISADGKLSGAIRAAKKSMKPQKSSTNKRTKKKTSNSK